MPKQLIVRFSLAFLALSVLFLGSFALWGDLLETLFDAESSRQMFAEAAGWGWLLGIGLLVSDLLLPIPATGVMTALGYVYGSWLGSIISIAGSTTAGFLGFFAAYYLGSGKFTRMAADEKDVERFRSFFDRYGGLAIILSRMLPVLPEVMVILAGLARMHPSRFSAALLLGTIPTATLFAVLGQATRSHPVLGLGAGIILPAVIWLIFLFLHSRARQA